MSIDISSDLIISRVNSVSTLYTLQHTKAKRNDRPYWAVVIKYEGETIYESNGKKILSDISHIAILPKGCSYSWECTKTGHYSIIEFESDQTFPEPLTFHVKHGEKVLRMCKDLESKRNLRDQVVEIESIRDTYSIILSILELSLDRYIPNSKRQKLQPSIEYISQNFGKRITNDELAAVSGMSTVYFRKLFAEIMGISPITYIKQLRIEKAKEMLKSDYGTLSDIAQSLGYSSLYDFSRDFKKHTGFAPSKYGGR